MPNARTWPMHGDDFGWAAQLMSRRSQLYAAYSPVFWRPRPGAAGLHARYLRSLAGRPGAVTLRSPHGFIVAVPQDRRLFVDDFAVESDRHWRTEGSQLLLSAWSRARSSGPDGLRVVTARQDEPKRAMLSSIGLAVAERWWAKALPAAPALLYPEAADQDHPQVQLVTAPPVYEPGGPVALLPDDEFTDVRQLDGVCEQAARLGAVLAVLPRRGAGNSPPRAEPVLQAAGFHNPSEFFQGMPKTDAGLRVRRDVPS
jgi:hypothetical protein